jgi:ankyrin repeat protein
MEIDISKLNFHEECYYRCRSSIIMQYIELYPESLAVDRADKDGYLPLHRVLSNRSSSIDIGLMVMEKYPAALQHQANFDGLPLHIECRNQCRSSIISKCIELYPEALQIMDKEGFLPLHRLMINQSSSNDDALMMIEKYPAALHHPNKYGSLPLHLECYNKYRSSVMSVCIELYPQALMKETNSRELPLHLLLMKKSSSIEDAFTMIERCTTALEHQTSGASLPLHIECETQCRSPFIAKCIELYPEALRKTDEYGCLPLHRLLINMSSSMDDALMMIEKYPAALQHQNISGYFPLHFECKYQCRSTILAKCIELYPEALTNEALYFIIQKVDESNFSRYAASLSIIFAARPLSLYDFELYSQGHLFIGSDIRDDPYYRRLILNLLPRHVFTSTHDADYRDLNWQPRAAMMALFSKIKRQPQSDIAY